MVTIVLLSLKRKLDVSVEMNLGAGDNLGINQSTILIILFLINRIFRSGNIFL